MGKNRASMGERTQGVGSLVNGDGHRRNFVWIAIAMFITVATVLATAAGAQGSSALSSGEPSAILDGAQGTEFRFTVEVPTGAVSTIIEMAGDGDADLYVSQGQAPTLTNWDCRPYVDGSSNETCEITSPTAGTVHVLVVGWAAFTDTTVTATIAQPATLNNGVAQSGLAGSQGSDLPFTFTIPADATDLVVEMSGAGDADLYLRRGGAPSTEVWDCRPYTDGSSNESCAEASPAEDVWHVLVRGWASFSGVSLTATWSTPVVPTATPAPPTPTTAPTFTPPTKPAVPGSANNVLEVDNVLVDVDNLVVADDFTVSAWVYFAPGSAVDNNDGLISSATNSINFWAGRLRVYDRNMSPPDIAIANTAAVTGGWNHYAVTRENGVARLYIDGVLDGVSNRSDWTNDFAISELMGGKTQGSTTGLNGQVDDLQIWDVARTPAQIQSDLTGNLEDVSDLLTRYTFDNTNTIADTVGTIAPVAVPNGMELVEAATPATSNSVLAVDNVRVDVDNLIITDDFTVSAWVRFEPGTAITNDDGLVSSINNSVNFFNGRFRIYDRNVTGNRDLVIANTVSQTGDWNHYSVTRENGLAKLYIDGALDAVSTRSSWTNAFLVSELMGGKLEGNTTGLNGSVDDLQIWDVARTPTQIQSDLTGNLGDVTDLLARYTFDDINTIEDTVGTIAPVAVPSGMAIVETAAGTTPTGPTTPALTESVLALDNARVDVQDLTVAGDFTVSAWVRFAADSPITNDDGLISSATNSINFFDGRFRIFDGGSVGDVIAANAVPVEGAWTHYAVTRQSGTTRLFVNGSMDNSSAAPVHWSNSGALWNGNLVISELFGGQLLGSTTGLHGDVDDFQIWNEARSQSELQLSIQGNLGDDTSNLLRRYTFENDSGLLVDVTGNSPAVVLPDRTEIIDTAAPALPPSTDNFTDTQVATGLSLPTDMAFLPDGRMIVIEKSGLAKLVEDPTTVASTIGAYIDIQSITHNETERGLLAVEVDPDFETNNYVYLYHTMYEGTTSHNTVARYVHVEGPGGSESILDPASRTVIWQEADDANRNVHHGGGLSIAYEPISANDPSPYKLYIVTSDESVPQNSADLSHEDGKVHRINLTDGSIPTDNPYYDPVTAAAYTPSIDTSSSKSTSVQNLAIDPQGIVTTIHSYGVRNGWRSSYDQVSETLFIGEVGSGINGYEDVHVAVAGANYGWPGEEGFLSDPTDPGNPIWSYSHRTGPAQDDGTVSGGASVTGGVVYRGDLFPEEYVGRYFYGDWARNWIRFLELDYSTDIPQVISDNFFKNTTGRVLSFEEGPDGALYYMTTFQTGGVFTFEGTVNRVIFDATNSAPAGQGIALDPGEESSTTAPHTVSFEADVFDPDGDDLSYVWSFGDGDDLDGDGIGDTAVSDEANPTYTFTEIGQYTVNLIVTDSNGAATVFPARIILVGNAPDVTIESPINGDTYRAGDSITATGSAFDVEDGLINNTETLVWASSYAIGDLSRPGPFEETQDVAGGISFTTPNSGDVESQLDSFTLYLTATDTDGLTSTETVRLTAEKSTLSFVLPDDEVELIVEGRAGELGSYTLDAIINFEHQLQAQETYQANGDAFVFSHWADDPSNTDRIRDIIVPASDTTFTPVYELDELSG